MRTVPVVFGCHAFLYSSLNYEMTKSQVICDIREVSPHHHKILTLEKITYHLQGVGFLLRLMLKMDIAQLLCILKVLFLTKFNISIG